VKIVCAWMYTIGKYGFPPSVEGMLKAIKDMGEMGFQFIELEAVGYENLDQVVQAKEKIKETIEKEELRVSNFAILLPDIISMDEKKRENAFENFERGVETARFFESPYVWIDSYLPPLKVKKGFLATDKLVYGQDFKVVIPEGFLWQRFWNSFVQAVIRCNEIAKKNDIGLLIEPRVGEVISNSDAMLRLIDCVKDKNFGVILDVAHQHAQKELIPLSIQKLGDHLKYVHVADNDGRDNRHLEPGKGTVDWEEMFRLFKHQQFDGFFAIDLEKLPNLRKKFVGVKLFLESYAAKYSI